MNHYQPNYYQVMSRYNQWMNQKIYEVCAQVSDEDRKMDRRAFFKSIHGTLDHILQGDLAWMGRFLNQPFVMSTTKWLYDDFQELRHNRELIDLKIINYMDQLEPEFLEANFEYKSNIYQKTFHLPTWVLITHLINHQIHHRGQISTLLCQLGYDIGITDLPLLPYLSQK